MKPMQDEHATGDAPPLAIALATVLNGREYGSEITESEERDAKKSGLVVVFGYSDDNMEFRGAIHGEVGCYDGGEAFVTATGILSEHDEGCDCPFCGYAEAAKKARKIEAVWDKEGYSWTYKTEIPHATFDIMEEGEKFCRGIVFQL